MFYSRGIELNIKKYTKYEYFKSYIRKWAIFGSIGGEWADATSHNLNYAVHT